MNSARLNSCKGPDKLAAQTGKKKEEKGVANLFGYSRPEKEMIRGQREILVAVGPDLEELMGDDWGSTLVSGSDYADLSRKLAVVLRALPSDIAKRVHGIRKDYIARYGFASTYE